MKPPLHRPVLLMECGHLTQSPTTNDRIPDVFLCPTCRLLCTWTPVDDD